MPLIVLLVPLISFIVSLIFMSVCFEVVRLVRPAVPLDHVVWIKVR